MPAHERMIDLLLKLIAETLHWGNGVFERQTKVLEKAFEFVLVCDR